MPAAQSSSRTCPKTCVTSPTTRTNLSQIQATKIQDNPIRADDIEINPNAQNTAFGLIGYCNSTKKKGLRLNAQGPYILKLKTNGRYNLLVKE